MRSCPSTPNSLGIYIHYQCCKLNTQQMASCKLLRMFIIPLITNSSHVKDSVPLCWVHVKEDFFKKQQQSFFALERMWGLKHKSHNCERCGNNFFSHSALRYHFHAKHLGRIPCDTCGQKLSLGGPRHHVEVSYHTLPIYSTCAHSLCPHFVE